MILPANASLILSAVQQLIKLGGRIDALLAAKTAVQADLVLGLPKLKLANLASQVALARKTLQATAGQQPDPFGSDRPLLQQQVNQAQPDASFDALFAKYFPDASNGLLVNPDAAYLAQLQENFPGLNWKDPGVRLAAFALASGTDDQQVSYNARVALAVADTLFEFGAEHTALFVRDDKLRGIAQIVLQRFAAPEWDKFTNWNPLLQTALKSALNAALDVSEKLPPENPWLAGVLDALIDSRTAATQPDNFLLGLVHGDGFRSLLSHGLLVASDRLDDAQADNFRLIAADMLKAAAPLIQDPANPNFRQFFNDHWGDLLRAGLSSVDQHGDDLLQGANPLLRDALKAMVRQLAATPDAGFLTSDTLYLLADTAIGIVAENPGEIPGLETKPWLREFLASAAQTAKQLTAKKLFTPNAAEALVLDAISVLAKHPDLIIKQQGLPLTLATDVLTAVAQLKRLDARLIGEATIRAALGAIGSDASLASGKFGPAIVAVTGKLAELVGQGKFTATQAAEIATAAIEATARNPQLFAALPKDLASMIVTTVQENVPDTPAAPWAGRLLVPLIREALLAVARSGGPAAANQPVAKFKALLADVLSGGLKLAATELGRSVDLDGIPPVLGGLIVHALRGDLKNFAPNSADFATAFTSLALARTDHTSPRS